VYLVSKVPIHTKNMEGVKGDWGKDIYKKQGLIRVILRIYFRTVAVTPSKLTTMPLDEAIRVSCDYADAALQTLVSLRTRQTGNDTPLRFILITGHFTPRTPEEVHPMLKERGMSEYALARVSFLTLLLPSFSLLNPLTTSYKGGPM
jgi:hypothetical protein